ncbi:uncharacterized protein CTRU02_201662 [Colletotrichum truncatum]|uniref:Uncharacterized protein n=1 Tax=Colletotrichum truncatum TaxID=5467 RepID=A0ACC3ZI24_COLTU|nr:uncharacterized protein CTRU02_10895 [Colletotrichum truncatum]KAF6786771.1 hypothetical protein CTRU02_10895 [Colletotrichum truncatum]
MIPEKPLPYSDEYPTAEAYVSALLEFVTQTDLFQILCGGVHVLDFFTNSPGLFNQVLPQEWQPFLLSYDTVRLLDLLMRDDLDDLPEMDPAPPESFLKYVRDIRRLSLRRSFEPSQSETKPPPKLSRSVAVGMKPKKVHEVAHFARYVDSLAGAISERWGKETTHFVDFGSGQNYLGRTLALPPYNRHVVAVEGREHNIDGAKGLDVLSGLASKEVVMRNKKLWQQMQADKFGTEINVKKTAKPSTDAVEDFDFRPLKELEPQYNRALGKGSVSYVVGRLESGDLTEVIGRIEKEVLPEEAEAAKEGLKMMAVSIHSCGNLSHYGIRSLIMNPAIHSVAIVGCCYNLLTEKLGPPTYKYTYARPSLQALNGRVVRESSRYDPEGFPLSERLATYDGHGIRMNITARMMACQAPQNWNQAESDDFFTRHLFRAVLQKIFLDKGIISKVYHRDPDAAEGETTPETPFNMSTNPVIIGSLRKACYKSLKDYVRGAVTKLTTNREYGQYSAIIKEKMTDISDEEISRYEEEYLSRKKEVAAVWSLMAFSACVVESLIVTDRWLFLKEHDDVVRDAWVETVFDYGLSPRNMVVVGIKR